MEKSAISLLQEFCQKNHWPTPNYRFEEKRDTDGKLVFQAQVDVNKRWYSDDEGKFCPNKQEAKSSVAQKAYEDLNANLTPEERKRQELEYLTMEELENRRHFPEEFAAIEDFFINLIQQDGGRIRRVKSMQKEDKFRVEITGNYRFCRNINKHHQKNQIFFIVDVRRRQYTQRCFDPDCRGYQSPYQPIPRNESQ